MRADQWLCRWVLTANIARFRMHLRVWVHWMSLSFECTRVPRPRRGVWPLDRAGHWVDDGRIVVTTATGLVMAGSKVELYAAIRRDARAGLSKRALQRKHRVGQRTVGLALSSAWPSPRKTLPPRVSRLDRFKPVIDEWLRADLDAPRKQRHTARRVLDRLLDEHDATGAVSYGMVRAYVATRRREIRVEAGRAPVEAFIPQSHAPGEQAEVDFGDVTIRLRGVQVKCALFSLRMSYSGKAVHRVFATGGQEAFLEGHVHAFTVLGGVPTGKVRYDNLKSAVASVIGFSRQRVETDRWIAFRSHYGLEAFYCQPGLTGAHEKGGVEGDVGWFRRNHFVPVPEVDSLAELNALVDQWDIDDDARRIAGRARTVGDHFAAEQPLLVPLPVEAFETGLTLNVRVDRYAQVTARTNRYSVPARLIGRQVRVLLRERPARPGRRTSRRPPRTTLREVRVPARPGPLPRRARAQTRRPAGRDRPGAGPRRRKVHPGARGVVGCGLQGPRRHRRHPCADRGPPAPPAHAPRPGRRRPRRRPPRGRVHRRRRRARSPPIRRRSRPGHANNRARRQSWDASARPLNRDLVDREEAPRLPAAAGHPAVADGRPVRRAAALPAAGHRSTAGDRGEQIEEGDPMTPPTRRIPSHNAVIQPAASRGSTPDRRRPASRSFSNSSWNPRRTVVNRSVK